MTELLQPNPAFERDDEQRFSITQQAHELVPLMIRPKRPLKVVVVDDLPIALMIMQKILALWPDLSVEYIAQVGGVPVVIASDTDIVLLDEQLIGTTGTKIHAEQMRLGSRAVFGSTSTNHCPSFTKVQFVDKTAFMSNRQAAERFVAFVNDLIALVP